MAPTSDFMAFPSAYMLAPLSAVYSAVTRARIALYRAGALSAHKIAAPVISVGNITIGGTGKTPLVEWIARAVARGGRRVCILTRGYHRADVSQRVIVSDGERLLADAREGGDEPRLLAEKLQGLASVISDADRVAAAQWALENFRSEVFILDDGFQHLRIERDLNIVTVDATNPWGGKKLVPSGRLREPLQGLKRADCAVITRAEQVSDFDALRAEVKHLSGGRPVLISRVRTSSVRPLNSPASVHASEGNFLPQPLAAFCAIGNPQAFFSHLRNDGYLLNYTRTFRDHHPYTQSDVETLVREAERQGARALLVTAKDAVKLRPLHFALPCYVIEIALEFEDEGTMLDLIREAISRHHL